MLGDGAAELVPEDERLVGAPEAVVAHALRQVRPVVDAVTRVQVRAADAAAQHLEADLARPRVARGPVLDSELTVLADDRFHAVHLSQKPDDECLLVT